MSKGMCEVKRYVWDNRRILEFIDIQTGKNEYQGSAVIVQGLELKTGEIVERNVPVDFPIEAHSTEAAFKKFDGCVNKIKNELQEAADKKVVTASKTDLDKIDAGGINKEIKVVRS